MTFLSARIGLGQHFCAKRRRSAWAFRLEKSMQRPGADLGKAEALFVGSLAVRTGSALDLPV